MDQKIEETIRNLVPGFFGEVTFGFKNGRAYFAKVVQTYNFDKQPSNRENQVDPHDNQSLRK
jgi:hypothetical protein